MNFDWSRYAVGGAAARADSFTGLNQDYAARVAQMLQAADAELGPGALKITSAYRSPELQAQLYQAAIKKYGSEKAARKWVAPPGKSRHNSGTAVDFAGPNGGLLRDKNSREARWIAENAARFGLAVPMSWEPWQVELAGDRAGTAPKAENQQIADATMAALGRPAQRPQQAAQAQGYIPQPYTPGNYIGTPQQPQNALAPQEQEQGPQMANTLQDPLAYMRPVNRLAEPQGGFDPMTNPFLAYLRG